MFVFVKKFPGKLKMRPVMFKRTRLIAVCLLLFLACYTFYKWNSRSARNRFSVLERQKSERNSKEEQTKSNYVDSDDQNETKDENEQETNEKDESIQIQNEIKEENVEDVEAIEEKENIVHSKNNEEEDHENLVPSAHPIQQTNKLVKPVTKKEYTIAVLVIACNRPKYVKKCIDSLLENRPPDLKSRFPIIVSQDCGHEETHKAIASYGDELQLITQPDLSNINGVAAHMVGYYKLSRHFKWALGQIFDVMGFESAVIVEDDLEIAPDFFEYFAATRPLLDQDPTIWCVSAWNDNGMKQYVENNGLLFRSDFFPGLGWMLKKSLWNELGQKWPVAFWDDWMRNPEQRQGRCCIRPEICRTKTFGENGVSQGQFFSQHLQHIKLNDKFYHFRQKDLSYLLKDEYDSDFKNHVYRIPLASFDDIQQGKVSVPAVRVQYEDNASFESLAHQFGIMTDLKAGVPRMAYKAVVVFVYKGIRVFLAPPSDWSGYQ